MTKTTKSTRKSKLTVICPYCDAEFGINEEMTCSCQRTISIVQWLIDNHVIESHPLVPGASVAA